MMAKLCSNLDGNICLSDTIVDKNQTYEPLLPDNLVISKSNYDILENVKNANNTYTNTIRGRIEQRDCTKEHNQTSERFTSLDNSQAKVEHDDYYTEIHTQTSCNSDVYESIDAKELNPTHCASTHLTRSCNKLFTFKGRRRKCLACLIFCFFLAVVIAVVTVFLLQKNNSPDPEKQNTQAQETACSGEHCLYNGTCTELGNIPICACTDGYNGSRCEVTQCHSSPCLNGGKCTPTGSSFVCSCPNGYFGNQCIGTPCNSSPCLNRGTCKPSGSSFVCSCSTGYSGNQCQITPCHSSPCLNGGRCTSTRTGFDCSCPTGYNGNRCQGRPSCPSGWKMNENSCYFFSSIESANWNNAKSYCQRRCSMLAEVTTTSEMTFLWTNAKKHGKTFWLGGSDLAIEGVWVWTTSGQGFTVTDWHTRTIREPNNQNGNENCLTIDDDLDYEWNNDKCSIDYRFICEKRLI